MAPWFSLILPCYNVERYVERCVQSILSQEFTDFEIILVNDGSKDRTPAICDELAQKHSCIRVLHKENGGLSSARNAGLDAARGKYIWFIDSDDWIEPEALIQLHQACCNGESEVIKFAHYRVVAEKTFVPLNVEAGFYQGRDQLDVIRRKAFCEAGQYCLSAWCHVYKRCFLKTYQLEFVSERVVGSEDYLFNLQALLHMNTLRVISSALYAYELRMGSLTQTYKPDLVERYCELYRQLKQYNQTLDKSPAVDRLIDRFFVWHLAIGTGMTQEYSMIENRRSAKQARKAVRCILKRKDVQKAAKDSDQTGLCKQKVLQLYAIRLRLEGLFYFLYVVKPGIIHDGKRQER